MSARTPAQKLAAVLEIVKSGPPWTLAGAYIVEVQGHGPEFHYAANNKDDLARVVAMLSPRQRERFVEDLEAAFSSDDSEEDSFTVWIITTPAATWLDALVAATEAAA